MDQNKNLRNQNCGFSKLRKLKLQIFKNMGTKYLYFKIRN